VVNPDVFKLIPYLEDCLSFERFGKHEGRDYGLHELVVEGPFFARSLNINYRRILFDVVAMNQPRKHRHQDRR